MLRLYFFAFSTRHWYLIPVKRPIILKRSGAFIPGIRPGEQTANYIDTVMTRLTLAGAVYITAVSYIARVFSVRMAGSLFILVELLC